MISISPVKVWRHQKEVALFLGKEGKIVSWTLIRVPPAGYEQEAPYPVVLVEFRAAGIAFGDARQDQRQVVGQLVDWTKKDFQTGKKVKIVYRRIRKPDLEGVIPYGIKFRPV